MVVSTELKTVDGRYAYPNLKNAPIIYKRKIEFESKKMQIDRETGLIKLKIEIKLIWNMLVFLLTIFWGKQLLLNHFLFTFLIYAIFEEKKNEIIKNRVSLLKYAFQVCTSCSELS